MFGTRTVLPVPAFIGSHNDRKKPKKRLGWEDWNLKSSISKVRYASRSQWNRNIDPSVCFSRFSCVLTSVGNLFFFFFFDIGGD